MANYITDQINQQITDQINQQITDQINDIIVAPQLSLEIAKLLLKFVFIDWNMPDCLFGDKAVRKVLVVDFYQILSKKQSRYFEELEDYTNNSEYHSLVQTNIKCIASLIIRLQTKEFHDEIIYYMNILS